MDPLPLREIAEMARARLVTGDGETRIARVCKDTRTIQPGDLYLSLRGEKFDGDDFAMDAVSKGAAAILVHDESKASGVPVLVAADGLVALHKLAAAWRSRIRPRVLCITGSNGKTSTKEFAAAVLGTRFRVVKTAGNYNNHIGVPLSILSASSSDTAAVWEVAMNHPGEIAPLAALCQPEAAIITGIGVAHIEYMKTRDAIALEKGALAEAVPPSGFVVLSADCDKTQDIAKRCGGRVVTAGLSGGAFVAENLSESEQGASFDIAHGDERVRATIPANGSHMVRNALLAVAAGVKFGIPLAEAAAGLAATRLVGGRLEKRIVRDVIIYDDTYNANPDSVEAALRMLKGLPGTQRRIAVLGRMGELGDYAAEGYKRCGEAAAQSVDVLVTVGDDAAAMAVAARDAGLGRAHETPDAASAAAILRQIARAGDIVLVKGSRSARMEAVIEHFAP